MLLSARKARTARGVHKLQSYTRPLRCAGGRWHGGVTTHVNRKGNAGATQKNGLTLNLSPWSHLIHFFLQSVFARVFVHVDVMSLVQLEYKFFKSATMRYSVLELLTFLSSITLVFKIQYPSYIINLTLVQIDLCNSVLYLTLFFNFLIID